MSDTATDVRRVWTERLIAWARVHEQTIAGGRSAGEVNEAMRKLDEIAAELRRRVDDEEATAWLMGEKR